MRANMGKREKMIRVAAGSAAAATAIFAPMRNKWKGLLTAAAVSGILTGAVGYSPIKRALGLGR